ncbi:RPS27D [Ecytonucleospora hepatopenaei]|uniref:40S ribosomal protein S27 n=1 Tax=Ecytonucleospora hepatopenaei TaxID=646526 RepID=A0A1W0E5Y3_9MICR|nr:RPS27D [Ecytonucleospora hepatopenaei]
MADLHKPHLESNKHKKKRIFRTCNSYFMHLKCKDCETTTIGFSHSQTPIKCKLCSALILKPTGGKAKLAEGVAFKVAENEY